MATKKQAPVEKVETMEEEVPVQPAEEAKQPSMEDIQAELEKLKAENERLKKNSVQSNSLSGSKSDYERVQEVCLQAAKAGKDPWGIKISIRAPRRPKKEDPFYWVCVNGRSIQIPANDRYFEMALPFAETLVNMINADNMANDYIDSIEVFDPVTNPHKDE